MWTKTLLFSLCLGISAGPAAAVKTYNAKMAASLSSVAVRLPTGHYTFTNAATGENLHYEPNGNWVFATKSQSTAVGVTSHSIAPWIRLQLGPKNKCLASAWGGSFNNLAVMYQCAVGKTGVRTTLEPTKQWWLAISVHKTKGNSKASTSVLLAAQQESVKVRAKKIAAQQAAFKHHRMTKRETDEEEELDETAYDYDNEEDVPTDPDDFYLEDDAEENVESLFEAAKAVEADVEPVQPDTEDVTDSSLEKRGRKTKVQRHRRAGAKGKVVGTYYIVPSDHLIDQQTRALSSISRRGKGITLVPFKEGNKAQQWILRQQ